MLEIRDLRGGPVARKHNLFMAVEQRVERVKEFLLRSFLAAEKLDVVDQQQIGLPVLLPEFNQRGMLDRIDELVDEELARKIHHLGVLLFGRGKLADRL